MCFQFFFLYKYGWYVNLFTFRVRFINGQVVGCIIIKGMVGCRIMMVKHHLLVVWGWKDKGTTTTTKYKVAVEGKWAVVVLEILVFVFCSEVDNSM